MRRLTTLLAVAASLAACSSGGRGVDGESELQVLLGSRAGTPPAAAYVRLTGTTAGGAAVDAWHPLAPVDGSQGHFARLTVPKGAYTLEAHGYATAPADPAATAADQLMELTAPLVVGDASQVAAVVIDPVTLAPKVPANFAPKVTALLASPASVDSSVPGALVTLSALASDRNGPADITPGPGFVPYAWTAVYKPVLAVGVAPGVFSAPNALNTTYTVPLDYAGTIAFTFQVTDKAGAIGTMSLAVPVAPAAAGNVAVTASVNNWPDITSLVAPDALVPSGGSTTFTVAAIDPDGDGLAYAWSDNLCGGTFGTPTAATTTYVAPALVPPATVKACRITATVQDVVRATPTVLRGGTNAQSVTINVGEPIPEFAPTFGFCVGGGAVAPGAPAYFSAEAAQTVAGVEVPVTAFTWSDDTGRIPAPFAEVVAGVPAAVHWTAPPCGGATAPVPVVVRATATGSGTGAPLSSSFDFPVQVICP